MLPATWTSACSFALLDSGSNSLPHPHPLGCSRLCLFGLLFVCRAPRFHFLPIISQNETSAHYVTFHQHSFNVCLLDARLSLSVQRINKKHASTHTDDWTPNISAAAQSTAPHSSTHPFPCRAFGEYLPNINWAHKIEQNLRRPSCLI